MRKYVVTYRDSNRTLQLNKKIDIYCQTDDEVIDKVNTFILGVLNNTATLFVELRSQRIYWAHNVRGELNSRFSGLDSKEKAKI